MVLPTVCAHAMSAEHELCTVATSSQGAPLAVFSIGYAIETSIGLQLACEGLETERASFREHPRRIATRGKGYSSRDPLQLAVQQISARKLPSHC